MVDLWKDQKGTVDLFLSNRDAKMVFSCLITNYILYLRQSHELGITNVYEGVFSGTCFHVILVPVIPRDISLGGSQMVASD